MTERLPDLDDEFYPFSVADRFYQEYPDNGWAEPSEDDN